MPDVPTRPLTEPEALTLEFLLQARLPGVEELRRQIQAVQVVGQCDCGCATVDLRVDRDKVAPAPAFAKRSELVVAAAASRTTAIQHPAAVWLFVDAEGWLRELEIVDWVGENPQPVFPPVDSWEAPQSAEDFFTNPP